MAINYGFWLRRTLTEQLLLLGWSSTQETCVQWLLFSVFNLRLIEVNTIESIRHILHGQSYIESVANWRGHRCRHESFIHCHWRSEVFSLTAIEVVLLVLNILLLLMQHLLLHFMLLLHQHIAVVLNQEVSRVSGTADIGNICRLTIEVSNFTFHIS